MPDVSLYIVLSVAVFAGALVAGLAGFAFSAVAGAIQCTFFHPWKRCR
jgi:uncharacterized protein